MPMCSYSFFEAWMLKPKVFKSEGVSLRNVAINVNDIGDVI